MCLKNIFELNHYQQDQTLTAYIFKPKASAIIEIFRTASFLRSRDNKTCDRTTQFPDSL